MRLITRDYGTILMHQQKNGQKKLLILSDSHVSTMQITDGLWDSTLAWSSSILGIRLLAL